MCLKYEIDYDWTSTFHFLGSKIINTHAIVELKLEPGWNCLVGMHASKEYRDCQKKLNHDWVGPKSVSAGAGANW